jgi:hypothetical protein
LRAGVEVIVLARVSVMRALAELTGRGEVPVLAGLPTSLAAVRAVLA